MVSRHHATPQVCQLTESQRPYRLFPIWKMWKQRQREGEDGEACRREVGRPSGLLMAVGGSEGPVPVPPRSSRESGEWIGADIEEAFLKVFCLFVCSF